MSENYDRIKLLGEGAFGKAYLAKCKTSKSYIVLKEINLSKMSPKEKQEARKEVKVLSRLEHCCIVTFLNSYETSTFLVIVMEFCDNGDLQNQLKSRTSYVPEDEVLNWFVQICLALKHLHDRKILHRDIKSQNIFLTKSGLVKLGDFGIAKVLNSTSEFALTQAGTPYYLSPEICDAKPYNNKSDIWSMGCILYEMASLKHPFNGKSVMDLIRNIKRCSYAPLPTCYRIDIHELVSKLLKKNPRDRPDINSVLRFPVIWQKIGDYLSKEDYEKEFSHTILHGFKTPTSARLKWQRKNDRHIGFINFEDEQREGRKILKMHDHDRHGVGDFKMKQQFYDGRSKAKHDNKIEMKKHKIIDNIPKFIKRDPQKDIVKNFLIRRNEYAEKLRQIRMKNLRKNLTPRCCRPKASNDMNRNRQNIQKKNKKDFVESYQRDMQEVQALCRIESAMKSKKRAKSKNSSGQKTERKDSNYKYRSPPTQRRRNSCQPDLKCVGVTSTRGGRSKERKSLPNIKDEQASKEHVRKHWNIPQSSMSKKKIINIECLEDEDETYRYKEIYNETRHSEVKDLLMTGTLDVINPMLLRTCSEPDLQNIEGHSSSTSSSSSSSSSSLSSDGLENKHLKEKIKFKASKEHHEGDNKTLLRSKSTDEFHLVFPMKSTGELSSNSMESSSESNDELNSVRKSMASCLTLAPKLNVNKVLENIQENNEDEIRSSRIAWGGTNLGLQQLQSTILKTVKYFDTNHIGKEYFEDVDHDSNWFPSGNI